MAEILIVGGGPAGATLAKALDKDEAFRVTLVDTKPFFENTPSTPAMILRGSNCGGPAKKGDAERAVELSMKRYIVPHTQYVRRGRVIVGRVASVDDDWRGVTLEDGTALRCDHLVLATGSSYGDRRLKVPADEEVPTVERYRERLEALRAEVDALADGETVLVVGGGSAGVETAAELVESHPRLRVKLCTSGDRLLLGCPDRLSRRAADHFSLAADRCEVVFNARVAKAGDGAADDDDGKEYTIEVAGSSPRRVRAGLVFWCVGARPATRFLADGVHAAVLDDRGRVRVDQAMRVEGFPHALALGDCAQSPHRMMAKNAIEHAKHAARALRALQKGEEPAALPAETPGFIVSLGGWSAVGDLGAVHLTGWTKKGSRIASFFKNQTWRVTSGALM